MPGTKRKKLDELSRKLYWKVKVAKDNENQKLIKEELICRSSNKGTWNRYKIETVRRKDEEVVRVVKEIKKTEVKCWEEMNSR